MKPVEMLLPAGRELDAMIVEHFLGGYVQGDPEDWSVLEEVWFWKHPRDGVLIGEPYWVNTTEEKRLYKLYSHSWRKFEPSTNIAQTFYAVQRLNTKYRLELVQLGFPPKMWRATLFDAYVSEGWEGKATTVELAICRAIICILTGPPSELNAGSAVDLRPVG